MDVAAMYSKLAQSSRYMRAQGVRRVLRWLVERHGAPHTIIRAVPLVPRPSPRAITATNAERDKILNAATPYMRCFILLCSDLALRSGTAATICPNDYNEERREITCKTKYGNNVTLPVTDELVDLFASCKGPSAMPYVHQLHPQNAIRTDSLRFNFAKLRKDCKISKQLTPHDLRRTTAVRTLELTHDLRVVQALLGHRGLSQTLHYLDHNNTPVSRATLETAKLNAKTEAIQ
jgi:integrase